MIQSFAILLLAVLLTACSPSLEPSDPEAAIQARAGRNFNVILESDPSAGYYWDVVHKLDKSVIHLVL